MDFYSSQYYPHSHQATMRQPYGGYAPRGRYMDRYPTHQQVFQQQQPQQQFSLQDADDSGKTLWMGNIDETMDETFIQYAFNSLGINVQNVKIIRNRDNGLPLGYGFISFDDRNTAQDVLRDLNGKIIPNVENEKRFLLKRASRNGRFTVFVGNLKPQITSDILMEAFLTQYKSVSSAKVIMSDGVSKGFGFVSFNDEGDYYHALNQQSIMLGQNQISVNRARNSNNRVRYREFNVGN